MTDLRERIVALVDQRDPPEDTADRILALFREEAPPSDEELQDAFDGPARNGEYDLLNEDERKAAFELRSVYDLGHARGCAKSEAERAGLQRRSEGYERGLRISQQCLTDALTRARKAERERDAAREELREVGEALCTVAGVVALWKYRGPPAGIIAALLEAARTKDPGAAI